MGLIRNLDSTSGGCVIGKIQVGEKKANANFPNSLDYFVANSPYESAFKAAYGDKPTQIEIMFTKDERNIDEVLQLTFNGKPAIIFETRAANFLAVASKQNARYFLTPKGIIAAITEKFMFCWVGETWQQFAIPNIAGWPELVCKHSLILRFRIPKITLIDGLWEYRTGAVSSREPIKATLLEAQEQYWEWIDRIPFDMNVRISHGNAMDKKYPVVNIVMNLNKAEHLQTQTFRPVANAAALLSGNLPKQLHISESEPEQIFETTLENEDETDYSDELESALANER